MVSATGKNSNMKRKTPLSVDMESALDEVKTELTEYIDRKMRHMQ